MGMEDEECALENRLLSFVKFCFANGILSSNCTPWDTKQSSVFCWLLG